MLRSGPLKRFLSFLRRTLGRPPAAPAPSLGTEAAPPLATPAEVPQFEVGEQPSHAPKTRSERTIVVGVDFGTSTTKVIWQDLSDNQFEVIRWQSSNEGLSSFLLPSTVLLRDGSLRFGISGTEAREGDVWLHSIKLCVLCRRRPAICRCGNQAARDGMVRVPGFAEIMPTSALACLFLAYVFREVESELSARFPDENLILIWNVGCPMDHLDIGDLRSEWERMTGAALELRSQVSSSSDMSLLDKATQLVETLTIAPASERSYFVQPEGLAAVKAFLESPHAESKTYAIVDVGAGTTEVSFFFNGRAMMEHGRPFRPSYLADSTEAVGGVKIDLELAQAWGCCVDEARRRKERGESLPMAESIEEIRVQYQRTCGEIVRQKKLIAPDDKRFDLFVIGGGGRLRPLQRTLQYCDMPGGFVREHARQLKPPRSLKGVTNLQEHYDFLTIACGLASSLDWEYYPPKEVGPMSGPPTKPPPDPDEYYPK